MPSKRWIFGSRTWNYPGLNPIVIDTPVVNPVYSATNLPTTLAPGASYLDNKPAGVMVVNAADYSSTTDLPVLLRLIESQSSLPAHVYVQLDKPLYWVNNFINYGTSTNPNWLGYVNGNKRIMGLISPPGGTRVRISPTAVSSTPGAAEYAMDPSLTGPVPITALYFSGSGASVPGFFSGIRRQGTFQTPYSVPSANARSKLSRNQTNPSPLPWKGEAIWAMPAGSRIQYASYEGWSFAMNSAPPYEMGTVDCNRNVDLTFEFCDFDGRLAAEVNSARPRSGGGLMWNKDLNIKVKNSWLHHTRRSGWAMNTNTNDQNERYEGINFQVTDVANTGDDGFASDITTLPGQFGGSNVEGLAGRFYYTDVFFSVGQLSKVNIAIPYRSSTGTVITIPDRPMIIAKNVTTDDTLYGKCVRYGISKTPNSTGTSPAWTKVNTLGIQGSGLFDIVNSRDEPMVGVRTSDYNPALHKPDTHFIVSY